MVSDNNTKLENTDSDPPEFVQDNGNKPASSYINTSTNTSIIKTKPKTKTKTKNMNPKIENEESINATRNEIEKLMANENNNNNNDSDDSNSNYSKRQNANKSKSLKTPGVGSFSINPKDGPDNPNNPPIRRRNRMPLSCNVCRKRKVKVRIKIKIYININILPLLTIFHPFPSSPFFLAYSIV